MALGGENAPQAACPQPPSECGSAGSVCAQHPCECPLCGASVPGPRHSAVGTKRCCPRDDREKQTSNYYIRGLGRVSRRSVQWRWTAI